MMLNVIFRAITEEYYGLKQNYRTHRDTKLSTVKKQISRLALSFEMGLIICSFYNGIVCFLPSCPAVPANFKRDAFCPVLMRLYPYYYILYVKENIKCMKHIQNNNLLKNSFILKF